MSRNDVPGVSPKPRKWATGTTADGYRERDELERRIRNAVQLATSATEFNSTFFDLTAPNGVRYRITVDNAGVLSTKQIL